jgi:glycosyltransferase involved in cell wall biosynthesis
MRSTSYEVATEGAAAKALVVSLSAPEMDRLAAELAARGSLAGMVRRYLNKGRRWERLAARLPISKGLYASTFGRRMPPAGVRTALIREAGATWDFAAAIVNRAGRSVPDLAAPLSRRLQGNAERAVARAASRHVSSGLVVVGSYHVALPAFATAKRIGARTILNYPIAHHRWQYRLFAEQAERKPEFAAALPSFGNVAEHASGLDREIELADSILVGSQFVRDTFVAQGICPDKIRVIPYGVDTARFAPAPQPRERADSFRVLFVGQIGERKGVSYLLEAYEKFRRPDTELLLVGDFVKGAQVYKRASELFRHSPNVAQPQLPPIFHSADVFVLPTFVEGMPLVVLEAMACGLPVIVTPHGPADVVRDGVDGFIVPCGDSAAIAARLEQLYTDPERRLEMGRNARRRAEQWSWSRYAAAAADFVLGEGRSAA